jgi:WD40 repeat protein
VLRSRMLSACVRHAGVVQGTSPQVDFQQALVRAKEGPAACASEKDLSRRVAVSRSEETRKRTGQTAASSGRGHAPSQANCPLCGGALECNEGGEFHQVACPSCRLAMRGSQDQRDTAIRPAVSSANPFDRWLAGDPLPPRRLSTWGHMTRWCMSHRFVTTLSAACLAVLVGVAVSATPAYFHASSVLKSTAARCREAEERCEQARTVAARQSAHATRENRLAEDERNARLSAEGALREVRAQCQEMEQRLAHAAQERLQAVKEVRLGMAQRLAEEAAQALPSRPLESLFLAAVSGRTILREGATPSLGQESVLREALAKVGHPGFAVPTHGDRTVVLSPDGRWLAAGGEDGVLRLWNIASDDVRVSPCEVRRCGGPILAATFASTGRYLAVATPGPAVAVWDLGNQGPPAPPAVLQGSLRRITSMAVSPGGRWLAVGGIGGQAEECQALLWDLADRNRGPLVLRGHEQQILASKFSPDERWLITAGQDLTVRLWDLNHPSPAQTHVVLRGHRGWIDCLAVTPNGRWLASGSNDGTVRLWRLGDANPAADGIVLRGHSGWITALTASPDGRWLVTGSGDNTARLWDLTAGDPRDGAILLTGQASYVRAAAFSPDGQWLVTASQDKTMRLYNLAKRDTAPPPTVLGGPGEPVGALVINAGSRWLIAAGESSPASTAVSVSLWPLQTDGLVETARRVAVERFPLEKRVETLREAASQGPQPAAATEGNLLR